MRDISFVRVDVDTISQTSFAISAKSSDAQEKNIGDAMVDKGAKAPKPRLSPVGMHTSTPAGDLLNTNSNYTTQGTIFSYHDLFGALEKRSSTILIRHQARHVLFMPAINHLRLAVFGVSFVLSLCLRLGANLCGMRTCAYTRF